SLAPRAALLPGLRPLMYTTMRNAQTIEQAAGCRLRPRGLARGSRAASLAQAKLLAGAKTTTRRNLPAMGRGSILVLWSEHSPVRPAYGANMARLAKALWRATGVPVLTGAAMALLLGACGKENQYVAPPPPKVIVQFPLQQTVTPYLEATG